MRLVMFEGLRHAVAFDLDKGTVRPETEDGDEFFGLVACTNGTAAESRRACVMPVANRPHPAPTGSYRWVTSRGHLPTGLQYQIPDGLDRGGYAVNDTLGDIALVRLRGTLPGHYGATRRDLSRYGSPTAKIARLSLT